MKKTISFGLIALFMTILVYSQSAKGTSQTVNQTGLRTLTENGYSIQYPDKWDLDKTGHRGTNFILFSKLASPKDQFRENVNLIIQDLSDHNIDLAQYTEISEAQIKTMITNGNVLESKKLTSNGIDFQRVIFTGRQGIYDLKFEQYYWIKKQKAYVLTLTCEIKEFDNYKTAGEKILNSFRLN